MRLSSVAGTAETTSQAVDNLVLASVATHDVSGRVSLDTSEVKPTTNALGPTVQIFNAELNMSISS